jgi:hypothetical protein
LIFLLILRIEDAADIGANDKTAWIAANLAPGKIKRTLAIGVFWGWWWALTTTVKADSGAKMFDGICPSLIGIAGNAGYAGSGAVDQFFAF